MKKNRLSKNKQTRIIELFVAETTARTAASLVSVNKTTTGCYFQRLRQQIYEHSEHLVLLEGGVEADESYFGDKRKGKRGRGAAGKVPVFDLLKRSGKVFTVVIQMARIDTLFPIIRQQVKPDSIVYTDTWRSYHALDVSEFKHYRINHSKLFANKHNHINRKENFWNQAKPHLSKFNGVPKHYFHLFLKKCEWHFNNSDPKNQLKQLNQWVKYEMG